MKEIVIEKSWIVLIKKQELQCLMFEIKIRSFLCIYMLSSCLLIKNSDLIKYQILIMYKKQVQKDSSFQIVSGQNTSQNSQSRQWSNNIHHLAESEESSSNNSQSQGLQISNKVSYSDASCQSDQSSFYNSKLLIENPFIKSYQNDSSYLKSNKNWESKGQQQKSQSINFSQSNESYQSKKDNLRSKLSSIKNFSNKSLQNILHLLDESSISLVLQDTVIEQTVLNAVALYYETQKENLKKQWQKETQQLKFRIKQLQEQKRKYLKFEQQLNLYNERLPSLNKSISSSSSSNISVVTYKTLDIDNIIQEYKDVAQKYRLYKQKVKRNRETLIDSQNNPLITSKK